MRNRFLLFLGVLASWTWHVAAQDAVVPPGVAAVPSYDDAMTPSAPNDFFQFLTTQERAWLTAEFLFGWIEGAHLPPLVTTSPTGTDQSVAGVLGEPDTRILLSGTRNRDVLSGFRLGGGYVYDSAFGLGVEAGFTYLPGQSSSFFFSSDDNAILARPYINATSEDPEAVLVAFPGNSTGTITVTSKSGALYETHLDLSERIWEVGGMRAEALFGYRFVSFSDKLRIAQHIDSLLLPGTSIDSLDDFDAKNRFHGLDLGLRGTYAWTDRLSLNLLGKVAVGNMHRTVTIRGQQVTTVAPDPPVTASGGVYALDSNIGKHTRNDWTVLPEAAANLTYQLRSNIHLRLGYSLLYLTKAARADNQIDFFVNPDLFPPANPAATPQRPHFQIRNADFWVQTLNLGLDVTF